MKPIIDTPIDRGFSFNGQRLEDIRRARVHRSEADTQRAGVVYRGTAWGKHLFSAPNAGCFRE